MPVMRTANLQRVARLLLLAPGMAMISSAAQSEKAPPKELVQYIREAKGRGASEARIRQQAVAAGWAAATVEEALAFETREKSAPAETSLTAAAQSQAAPAKPNTAADPSAAAPAASQGLFDDYQIGSGDTLQISVWKEADVSVPSVVVRPDGRITVPLIKEVEVAGLTPRQAEKVITEGLSKFITEPNVTVVVAAILSKKVYVIGGTRREGPLPYNYGMTVVQALSEAGGLTDYAKRKKIYILRSENGREYRLDFNYDEVVKGERMEQNIVLLPGDTVVVPR
jgi:polysaccharide export outer membrane protein